MAKAKQPLCSYCGLSPGAPQLGTDDRICMNCWNDGLANDDEDEEFLRSRDETDDIDRLTQKEKEKLLQNLRDNNLIGQTKETIDLIIKKKLHGKGANRGLARKLQNYVSDGIWHSIVHYHGSKLWLLPWPKLNKAQKEFNKKLRAQGFLPKKNINNNAWYAERSNCEMDPYALDEAVISRVWAGDGHKMQLSPMIDWLIESGAEIIPNSRIIRAGDQSIPNRSTIKPFCNSSYIVHYQSVYEKGSTIKNLNPIIVRNFYYFYFIAPKGE